VLAWVSIVAAFVVGAVAAVRAGWVPVSDEALIELKVRDVPEHLPLVGVYSRFGWSHPGPLQFLLLSVPYRVAASSSVALLVATMSGHLAAVAAAWWLARRIDRVAGWTVLISLLAVLATTPADLLRTPWNPYVALVAAGALVVAAWSAAERSPWGVLALALLASLLVQAHVVALPLVAAVVVAAAAAMLWRRAASAPPLPTRALVGAAAMTALLWVLPVVDLLVGDPSNSRLLRTEGGGTREGLSSGVGVLTSSFAWWPAWMRPSTVGQVLVDPRWFVPIWLCVPVAGAVVAWRRHDGRYLRGSAVVAAALLGTVVTTAAMTGGLFNYLLVEHRSVSAVAMAVGAAALLSVVGARHGRSIEVGATVVVVALAVVIGVAQVRGDNPQAGHGATISALASAVESQVDRAQVLALSSSPDFRATEVATGLLLQLERAGYDVRTGTGSDDDVRRYGRHRVAGSGEAELELFVATVDAREGLESDGWRIVAEFDPMSDDVRAQLDELSERREQIGERIRAADGPAARAAASRELQQVADRMDALEADRLPMLLAARTAASNPAD
jgi:hypothetical protein